jgi:hypothetical protein
VTRLQFIVLTCLSVFVALCILLELYLSHAEGQEEIRLASMTREMQEGQLDYNHLQQVANWTAALAERQNDQALRDVLARNNIQVKPPTAPAAGAPASAPAAPVTR